MRHYVTPCYVVNISDVITSLCHDGNIALIAFIVVYVVECVMVMECDVMTSLRRDVNTSPNKKGQKRSKK